MSPRFWLIGNHLLGDLLMQTPAIRALRAHYPTAEIIYRHGTSGKAYQLLRHNPFLTRLEIGDYPPHDPGAQIIRMDAMRALITGMTRGCTLAEGFGEQLGVTVSDLHYDYVMSAAEEARGVALAQELGEGRPVVVVARHSVSCTSNDPTIGVASKCLPNRLWCDFAEWVRGRGLVPVAVGAAVDAADPVYRDWPGPKLYEARLRDVAALLRASAAVVSIDTGIRHLAAAVGAPLYCISCATPLSVIRCAPTCVGQRILEEHVPLSEASVEHLRRGTEAVLSCR